MSLTKPSQSNLCGLTLDLGAAMGSENPKKGSARLIKPFLKLSSFLLPLAI